MEKYEMAIIQGNQMSGDVFLSELFVRALSHISAMEQICVHVIGSYVLGLWCDLVSW